jgi:hypothetical protein
VYGVNNVTRSVPLTSFGSQLNTVYETGTWWGSDVADPEVVVPRWLSTPSYYNGTQFLYDASYIRLKNAELAYTFGSGWSSRSGISALKLYFNGNNLLVWSRMPDDRESNFAGPGNDGAYPMMRRFNVGLRITL